MTPNQEHELYLYLVTLAAHNSHKELEYCLVAVKDLVRRCERRAEEAAWEAARETYWNEDHPHDETPAESREREPYECKRYETLEDWRKLREEPNS